MASSGSNKTKLRDPPSSNFLLGPSMCLLPFIPLLNKYSDVNLSAFLLFTPSRIF